MYHHHNHPPILSSIKNYHIKTKIISNHFTTTNNIHTQFDLKVERLDIKPDNNEFLISYRGVGDGGECWIEIIKGYKFIVLI